MKDEQNYRRDLSEIRTMMERSSKFLSLSGWAGIMAGLYALAGAAIANNLLRFNPDELYYRYGAGNLSNVILLALAILVLAIGSAILLSGRKAKNRGESLWNAVSKRLLLNMSVPLVAGGLLMLIIMQEGLIGLLAPLSLVFYGLALVNAGNYTISELRYLGCLQILLGLAAAVFVNYGLVLWTLGFGLLHICYGTYMWLRYDRKQ